MKYLVLCMIIASNISINGKASSDSFLPPRDIQIEHSHFSDKSCYRPCKLNAKPQRCYFNFVIEPTYSDDGRSYLSVNGMTPGPPIHVCLHDIVIVKVKNKIPNQELAIHWHGVEQRGTPYMDGTPMITQCPIMYGSVYQYAFAASSAGTFFYHSDSVNQQNDGVYGALVVDEPQNSKAHAPLYDFDRSIEHTMIIGAKFPMLLSGSLDDISGVRPNQIVINGQQDRFKLFALPGHGYRIRLVNAIAVECAVNVAVHGHTMTVIASDGKAVQAKAAKNIKLYSGALNWGLFLLTAETQLKLFDNGLLYDDAPKFVTGAASIYPQLLKTSFTNIRMALKVERRRERMDVVVSADQLSGGYWIKMSGEGDCHKLEAHGMFLYSGFNYTSMIEEGPIEDFEPQSQILSGQQLQSLKESAPVNEIRSVYMGIDRNFPKFTESDIDFRYLSDAVPKSPHFPAEMSLRDGVVQINGKNFLYPNAPILLKPQDVTPRLLCDIGEEKKQKEPQCLQVLKAKVNDVIELILVNEGFGSNDSYTFHMHGYSMQVVATWQSPAGLAMSKKEFLKLDRDGLIKRNVKNPPIKDTINVPNKGFTIVRIKPEFGGSWLLECRSCAMSSLPAAILVNVPLSIPKVVVDSLPSCGNYKPADVLLH